MSIFFIVLGLTSAVTNLANVTLIFHYFLRACRVKKINNIIVQDQNNVIHTQRVQYMQYTVIIKAVPSKVVAIPFYFPAPTEQT